MARLKTKCKMGVALLMREILDDQSMAPYDWFVNQTLRLLPAKTKLIIAQEERTTPPALSRSWMIEFDCPFFTNDFEFEVTFERKFLSDGEKTFEYSLATEIRRLKEGINENSDYPL